jgi:alpha-beta hydrolase superfamily lysophospholipase
MEKTTRRKIRKWVLIILLIYIAVGISLYFLQEKFLFHPSTIPDDHAYEFDIPSKEVNLEVNPEKNINIVQFTVPDSVCKGVVLYFHGNMDNITRYAGYASHFTRNNYEVWMIDYPGFGKSTGERSEQILYADAMEMYKMARARYGPDSLILYGRSIGSGIASQLASLRSCKHLILETPYYSMDALMRHYAFIYPVSAMTKYHFPNHEYLEKVLAPLTIFHGTNDEVIPYKNSKRLLKLREKTQPGNTELVTIEKGKHNDLDKYALFQSKLDSVLQIR